MIATKDLCTALVVIMFKVHFKRRLSKKQNADCTRSTCLKHSMIKLRSVRQSPYQKYACMIKRAHSRKALLFMFDQRV